MPHKKPSTSAKKLKSSNRKRPLPNQVKGRVYAGVRFFDLRSGDLKNETLGPSKTIVQEPFPKPTQSRLGSHSPRSRMP